MASHSDDESSDDDFGPRPVAPAPSSSTAEASAAEPEQSAASPEVHVAKKRRVGSEFEGVYLESLPKAEFYEHSFMHRDLVTHVVVSKATEFIITGSADGHVKFWKKMSKEIEFVKHYQAHLAALQDMVVSPDGKLLVTTSLDQMIKIFEIIGFDMCNMVRCDDYTPSCAVWLLGPSNVSDRVAVGEVQGGKIRIYKVDESENTPLQVIDLHMSPVVSMSLNLVHRTVLSIDTRGMVEYWDMNTFSVPTDRVSFQFKSETDLYDLAKARTVPCCIVSSPNGQLFATLSRDKQIRIFDFLKGKLIRKYDESVSVYNKAKDGELPNPHVGPLSDVELVRRQAVERELESTPEALGQCNLVFDETSNFLIFGSLRGIKIVSIAKNAVIRYIGQGESAERFLHLALYQGVPQVDQQLILARASAGAGKAANAAGGNPPEQKTAEQLLEEAKHPDPTIFCTSFKRRRFYCISHRDPDESVDARDKLNELPTEEERTQLEQSTNKKDLPTEAILHTTMGDIIIKLFPQDCPRTVENFTTHIKNGYYDNVIFHRVIKGFMLQTGDPLGDGTGGESIWGKEFEDEFVRTLRHDRPYTLSMANAGPNTNGSQFFITTVPTPWLDNKHTVFGRVTKGFEVVTKIENLKTNKLDKPYDTVKILGADTH